MKYGFSYYLGKGFTIIRPNLFENKIGYMKKETGIKWIWEKYQSKKAFFEQLEYLELQEKVIHETEQMK